MTIIMVTDENNKREQNSKNKGKSNVLSGEKRTELVAKFKEFLKYKCRKKLEEAAIEEKALAVDFKDLDKFNRVLGDLLLNEPEVFFELYEEAVEEIEKLPTKVRLRVSNLPYSISIRDLRSKHIGKFISTEGIVRRASEIRPEIVSKTWECPACGETIVQTRIGTNIFRPIECVCGNRKGFKEVGKEMIDTRWIVIEEPFELTEGEKPSQVTVFLKEDLVSPDERMKTEPGNRLKITGILREVPRGKSFSVKLDFFLDANHVQPMEIGWEKIKITEKDEKEIKKLAKNPKIYDMLIGSIAPSIYGLKEIKESIVLQLFGGVPRKLKDKTKLRGDIHILLVGDPASGKSQLLKLVPQLVPRGKYVSGKGVTAAGLTASVSRDEQFMGGWVLEAGAMVLANKGLLAVDEFEKMSQEDQIAMHEALEQGSVSIAKASIVATLPAQTSVLAGGNPKFSRFDPYVPIAKQITIPDTLLSRFDLKFVLQDIPNPKEDKQIVDHILLSREDQTTSIPALDPEFVRKYIAYAKENCNPEMPKETGEILKKFYVETRRRAQKQGSAIPITLRQFEALLRLSEASARIQLSPIVRKQDAQRAIRLMMASLKQLGLVPETGEIDIDRTEGATTSKERSNIRIVLDIIEELSKKKKEILASEIEERAKKEGVENPEDIIERLKREGMLFEPSPGYVQKV